VALKQIAVNLAHDHQLKVKILVELLALLYVLENVLKVEVILHVLVEG